ncbi:hypothetical protein FOA52_003677 [Chlamydomonas sp. UWO 241]|nr:hypothetical protein FOA52_003677 [Chlamydomonas sp. UWO 241]
MLGFVNKMMMSWRAPRALVWPPRADRCGPQSLLCIVSEGSLNGNVCGSCHLCHLCHQYSQSFEGAEGSSKARVPSRTLFAPSVPDEPTCQKTFLAWVPFASKTLVPAPLMNVVPIWKMKTASDSPRASSVSESVVIE